MCVSVKVCVCVVFVSLRKLDKRGLEIGKALSQKRRISSSQIYRLAQNSVGRLVMRQRTAD